MALNKHDVFSSYVKIIQYWIFLLVARVAHVSFFLTEVDNLRKAEFTSAGKVLIFKAKYFLGKLHADKV